MKQTEPSPARETGIAVIGSHLASVAGDHPKALHAALAAGLGGASLQRDECYTVGEDEAQASPVLAAPMQLAGVTLNQHLGELLIRALAPLIAGLEERGERPPEVALLLPLDKDLGARAGRVDAATLRGILSEAFPLLKEARIDCLPYTAGATAALHQGLQRLRAGELESLLFCGADSLTNNLSYLQLAEEGRLATERHGNGVIPGAAAGALHLAPFDPTHATAPLALLEGVSAQREPHAGQASSKRLTGVSRAIEEAVAGRPERLKTATVLIQAHHPGVAQALEWQQAAQRLWPVRLEEPRRVAMMLGEIEVPEIGPRVMPAVLNLNDVLGETGAAALALQLAVACEQFSWESHLARFGFPGPGGALVCEMGDSPHRGAVALSPPPQAAPPNGQSHQRSNRSTLN